MWFVHHFVENLLDEPYWDYIYLGLIILILFLVQQRTYHVIVINLDVRDNYSVNKYLGIDYRLIYVINTGLFIIFSIPQVKIVPIKY